MQRNLDGAFYVPRDAEVACQLVGGSGGDDPERNVGTCEPGDCLRDGAITTDGNY